jgi:uncharacterized protein
MLVLLPPSETKRPGGRGAPLDTATLRLPELGELRERTVEALVSLSADPETAARVLRLGPTQAGEVAANAVLRSAPAMPAIDRYTGVLFDALDAGSLPAAGRRWLGAHVLIHSAPFGPVGALDRIPAYRLPAGAAVPGLPPLRRLWADAVTRAISEAAPPFVLDLRSEAYVALGPVPADVPAAYVRVVADGPDGTVRALNHFNKHAKGELVRALAADRPRIRKAEDLLAWAAGRGIALDWGERRIIILHVA